MANEDNGGTPNDAMVEETPDAGTEPTYAELKKELDETRRAMGHLYVELDNEKARADREHKRAEKNETYRKEVEGRVNRQAKDSVFTNILSYPKYLHAFVSEVFPAGCPKSHFHVE